MTFGEINAQWHKEQELTDWYFAQLTSNRDFYISPSSVTPAVTLEHNEEDYGSYFSFSSALSAFWDLSQTFTSYINSNFIGSYRDYNFLESSNWSYDPKPSLALQEKLDSLLM